MTGRSPSALVRPFSQQLVAFSFLGESQCFVSHDFCRGKCVVYFRNLNLLSARCRRLCMLSARRFVMASIKVGSSLSKTPMVSYPTPIPLMYTGVSVYFVGCFAEQDGGGAISYGAAVEQPYRRCDYALSSSRTSNCEFFVKLRQRILHGVLVILNGAQWRSRRRLLHTSPCRVEAAHTRKRQVA